MSREQRAIALPPDTDVEEAFHELVRAAIDQPRPSIALRTSVNKVLSLIGHPLSQERAA